jgi:hypothetical protein
MKRVFFLIIIIISNSILETQAVNAYKTDILKNSFKYTHDSKRSIELSELSQGCISVDCIPSIDHPQFGSIKDISYIRKTDTMMVVEYNGVTKAYPRKIMQVHEIVNDYFGEKPLIVTYCPLCATSVAFIPILDGKRVEFGVSGLLHNSDLVMYDRQTASLWGQITGRAIVGPKTGHRLKTVSVGVLTWEELKLQLPGTQILLRPKGNKSKYKNFQYKKYARSQKLMFPVAAQDARLAAKKFVYGIEIDGQYIAFEESYLKKRSPMVESFGLRTLEVTYKHGKVTARDKKTGDTFSVLRGYWFAWYAFHPDTHLRH